MKAVNEAMKAAAEDETDMLKKILEILPSGKQGPGPGPGSLQDHLVIKKPQGVNDHAGISQHGQETVDVACVLRPSQDP